MAYRTEYIRADGQKSTAKFRSKTKIGQWEFQIGPLNPVEGGDHLWMARWLLYGIAEE